MLALTSYLFQAGRPRLGHLYLKSLAQIPAQLHFVVVCAAASAGRLQATRASSRKAAYLYESGGCVEYSLDTVARRAQFTDRIGPL
jgi:hypothetical protein